MKRLKGSGFVFLLLMGSMIFGIGGCGMVNGQGTKVQETVGSHYVNDDGVIHAYPDDKSSEYLSESIGLYMQYLLLINDEENFRKQTGILKEHFLIEKDGQLFIPWRLYEEANVNALIDDVRIASVLESAAEEFSEPGYLKLAEQLLSAIEVLQHQQGIVTDYYDWSYELAGNRLTLSYLVGGLKIHTKSFEMLDAGKGQLFFPEYYDFEKEQYIESDEVHMIDQLLIAVNRFDQGIQTPEFEHWLIGEWREQGKIYGRYIRKTAEPAVDYESLAVYYYLEKYFERIGQDEFAKQAVQRAELLAGEELPGELHFFDFIHYQMMMVEQ